jgi:hypothetical protein
MCGAVKITVWGYCKGFKGVKMTGLIAQGKPEPVFLVFSKLPE